MYVLTCIHVFYHAYYLIVCMLVCMLRWRVHFEPSLNPTLNPILNPMIIEVNTTKMNLKRFKERNGVFTIVNFFAFLIFEKRVQKVQNRRRNWVQRGDNSGSEGSEYFNLHQTKQNLILIHYYVMTL